MKKILFLFCAVLLSGSYGFAQGDDHSEAEASTPAIDVFYGTRTLNLHTVKQMDKKELSYRICHRLGNVDGGLYEMFGLDGPASVLLGFDYGISDKITIGIGRNSAGKLLNGYAKFAIMQQTTDNEKPLSIGIVTQANMTYLRDEGAAINGFDRFENFSNRMSYFTQLMIARKLSDKISVQLSPSYTHQNLVEFRDDANDIFAVTGQASFRFTKKLGMSAEYNYVLNDQTGAQNPIEFYNSAGVSLDIVTGGHIFQIVLVNSFEMNEARIIPYTNSDFLDGKFRIGFNIARSFWL